MRDHNCILYDVTVRTLTRLHIGSGETLLKDYDYAVHEGKTWRLNLDALLEEKVTDERMAARIASRPPAELLKLEDFQEGSPLFRYVLPGEPRSKQPGAQVHEQIKDAWDRPYLPGSSLKGALRTAILWYVAKERGQRVTARELRDDPKFAAQDLEGRYLRQAGQSLPNYDLLRALHVGDSAPLEPSALTLVNAQVRERTQRGAPIELEAIRSNIEMHLRLKIDTALFSEWAQRHGLNLAAQRDLLEDLPRTVQEHTAHRVQREIDWCRKHNLPDLVPLYEQFSRPQKDGICFLQIGWGGGWESKTLGSFLQEDPSAFEEIARKFNLRRMPRGQTAPPGTPFPRTRRMIVRENRSVIGPLGWIRLTFERRA